MQLDRFRQRLEKRLRRVEMLFTQYAWTKNRNCPHNQVVLLDGLLSHAWQAWCRFCRDLLISSCLGARTKAGVVLPCCVAPATRQRLSFLAIRANKRLALTSGTNSVWRHEPTWGDVGSVVKIVSAIKPANSAQLLSAFGGVSAGPAHLQTVRNASVHLDDQSFAAVRALQIHYLSEPIRFPAEAAFWVDYNSADYAFEAWLDEMRIIADNAV